MHVEKIPELLFQALDEASRGLLAKVKLYCQQEGYELDISVVTFIEGLPDKQMKLTVLATKDDETVIWNQAPLEDSARTLGWNLYLYETMAEAKGHLRKAQRNLAKLEATESGSGV
jgi:hypothetical protein